MDSSFRKITDEAIETIQKYRAKHKERSINVCVDAFMNGVTSSDTLGLYFHDWEEGHNVSYYCLMYCNLHDRLVRAIKASDWVARNKSNV